MLFCFTFSLNAQTQEGIKFHSGTLDKVLAKAKKESKPIFIDCYTDWCGSCKIMDKTTFKEKKVGDYYNENMISVKYNMTKGDPWNINEIIKLAAYPSFVYIDHNKNLLSFSYGATNGEGMIELAKRALDPESHIYNFESLYKKGKKDVRFLCNYILYKQGKGQDVSQPLQDLVANTDNSYLSTEGGWDALIRITKTVSNPVVKYFVENRETFSNAMGELKCHQFWWNVASVDVYAGEKDGRNKRYEILKTYSPDFAEQYMDIIKLFNKYPMGVKTKESFGFIRKFIEKYYKDDAYFSVIGVPMMFLYLPADDKESLNLLVEYASRMYKLKPEAEIIDAYVFALNEVDPDKAKDLAKDYLNKYPNAKKSHSFRILNQ